MKFPKPLKFFPLQVLFWAALGQSAAGEQILFAGGGLGAAQSTREISDSESPFALSFAIDSLLTSDWTLGAEHQRSFKLEGLASNVSVTGLNLKFYFVGATPSPWPAIEELRSGEFLQSGYNFYAGLSIGFAQSSLPLSSEGESPNTTGVGLGVKSGIDMSLTNSWGLRGGSRFSTVLGLSLPSICLRSLLAFLRTQGSVP